MKTISVTNARNNIADLIDLVQEKDEVFGINRHGKVEAVIIKYPKYYNPKVDFMANIAMYGGAFDFLADEPEIYSRKDIKKKNV